MIFNLKQSNGFSLVETLVAITILLLVVVGPMTIIANATKSSSFSSEQVVAFFLAQEGAELAQKARDDLLLPQFTAGLTVTPDQAWSDFVGAGGTYTDCFNNSSGATRCGLHIDTTTAGTVQVTNCGTVSSCQLNLDSSSGERDRYTHDSSLATTPTVYTRYISMNEVAASQDVEVVSTVTWRTGSQQQEQRAEVRTYLYNVYGR